MTGLDAALTADQAMTRVARSAATIAVQQSSAISNR